MGPGSAAAPQKRCAASRARERSVAHTLSTSSLRAQRLVRRSFSEGGSNPESLRGGRLDCFAALAMTKQGASILILQMQARFADTASRSRGAFRPSFASSLHPQSQEGAGKAGCRLAPAVRCAKSTRRKTAQQHTGVANHSAFPARWLDGLCRALPGAEFLLASLTPTKFTDTAPVDASAAFART